MIASLLGGAGGLLWTLAAFVVALSIIVAVHEYGHYIVGRLTGIGAEVFSVGMGPVLYSRQDRRGTRWQIAALPVGGYVKFKGDANAASVGAADGPADARIAGAAIHEAPLWARAATVAAGPAFNFVMAIAIFAGMALWEGRVAEPLTVGELRAQGDLMPGDVLLAIEGEPISEPADLRDVEAGLPTDRPLTWTVERDGAVREVSGPHPFPALVTAVSPLSAAAETDIRAGDLIVSMDGAPVETFDELRELVGASGGAPITLGLLRGGEPLEATLTPRRTDIPQPGGGFETRWLAGLVGGLAFEPATVRVGPLEALGAGVRQMWFLIVSSLEGLWSIVTGAISSCNLSGPIGIAEASGAMAEEGLRDFVYCLAMLSVAVGLINLFPVPILDGGHLVFHAYEAVSGRPPSDRALRVLMAGGLAAILTLMVFAVTNDLFCP